MNYRQTKSWCEVGEGEGRNGLMKGVRCKSGIRLAGVHQRFYLHKVFLHRASAG